MSAVIPCLFGTTQGFEIVELAPLPFKMKDLLVAITNGEVELSLDSFCVKILRIKPDNVSYTWIGLYRKAYEMGFSREGGYYGAGVWLSGVTVDGRHVLDALEDLSLQIRKLALIDHKFQRKLTDIVAQLGISPALSALVNSKSAYVKGGISADARNSAFICQPRLAREIVAWTQTDALAHNFQSVIIAPSSAFPKAGASGNIKQYADITALERALEGDYIARLTKIDGLNKDLQKRTQSLEADLAQRKAEVHSLAQKNAQLEGLAAKNRMTAATDKYGRRGHDDDDDDEGEKEELSLGHPYIVAPFTFVVSVLLSMGLFYYLSTDWVQTKVEAQKAQSTAELKQALQSQKEQFQGQIAQLSQVVLDQAEQIRAQQSSGVDAGQIPGTINLGRLPNGEPVHASPETIHVTNQRPQVGMKVQGLPVEEVPIRHIEQSELEPIERRVLNSLKKEGENGVSRDKLVSENPDAQDSIDSIIFRLEQYEYATSEDKIVVITRNGVDYLKQAGQ